MDQWSKDKKGQWHHIATVYDGKEEKHYLNGQPATLWDIWGALKGD